VASVAVVVDVTGMNEAGVPEKGPTAAVVRVLIGNQAGILRRGTRNHEAVIGSKNFSHKLLGSYV
jgi:hypothetical protein